MGFLNGLIDSMRLGNDDDYDVDDDYEFEDNDDYDEEPQRGGIFGRKSAAPVNDDVDDVKPRLFSKPQKQQSGQRRGMEVTMIKPTSMDDSMDICHYMLDGKAVVLNMEGLHMEVAQRIIDFTSGAAFSMNGNLQKISNYIFIATPDNVELSGDFQNILAGNSDLNINGLNIRV